MYIQGNSSSSWWFLKVLLALVTLSQIFHNVLFVFLARTTTSFYKSDHADSRLLLVVFFVLACDFCRLCGAIRFFHPRHNGQWPPTSKDCYPRFYPLHLFSYLNSWGGASISLLNVECQTRELLVPFLLRLWYDAVLDWGLNPGTSHTRSQHSTTILSRRRCLLLVIQNCYLNICFYVVSFKSL